MKALILVGNTGAGKTHWIRERGDLTVCSANHYFHGPSGHVFNPALLGKAHAQCLNRWLAGLSAGQSVAVDNTNTKVEEISTYLRTAEAAGAGVEIHVFGSDLNPKLLAKRSVHSVPLHTITRYNQQLTQLLANWPPRWPRPIHHDGLT